jgi:hypothetical protein
MVRPASGDPGPAGSDREPFTPRTRVSLRGARWYINDELTNPGTRAEGLLMNVRMVNAVFEDRNKPDLDPAAITDRFLAHLPEYAAHGINAFTLNLQGGMPGYEGALNSAFEPDGSLRESYLARVARVIEAGDRAGLVVILGCFYQRQDQVLADEAAVCAAVVTWRIGSRSAATATSSSRSPASSTTTASTTAQSAPWRARSS